MIINEKRTIWGIVIVVILCVIIYNIPLIIRVCENDIEPFIKEKIKQQETQPKNSKNKTIKKKLKYFNILEEDLIEIEKNEKNENEKNEKIMKLSMISPKSKIKKGIPNKLENWIKNNFKNSFFKGYTIIVNKGDKIELDQLNMITKDSNDRLRKAYKVIYYFPHNTNWNINDGWLFHIPETKMYYVPENNTAIEFSYDQIYEWNELKTEKSKTFYVIYLFEN